MSMLGRKLRSDSTFAVAFAMVLFATPLVAQKTSLTVGGGTVTFPAPTAADYINGFVDAATGVTVSLNATQGGSRTTTVSIRSSSASLGNGKVIGDLQWRRADLATWNNMSVVDSQVEQRIMVSKGLNDPWGNTIFLRMKLSWATDAPGTYSANYVVTLSQTVP